MLSIFILKTMIFVNPGDLCLVTFVEKPAHQSNGVK